MSYLRATGRNHEAAAEIKALQSEYPADMKLVFAEADLRLWVNDPEGALKVLTRARTSELWINADLDSRAELEANLAFARWHVRKLTRSEAFDEVLSQLRRTEFANLAIAAVLPSLARDVGELVQLALVARIAQREGLPLRTRE